MPNWCDNTITISGPKDKIVALWETAKTSQQGEFGLLEAMVPLGEWSYDEAVTQWGCKWDINDEGLHLEIDGELAVITGWAQSAWSPPIDAMLTYQEANTDIEIRLAYYEPGLDFIGVYQDGEDSHYTELSEMIVKNSQAEDTVFADLIEEFGCEDSFNDEVNLEEDLAQ